MHSDQIARIVEDVLDVIDMERGNVAGMIQTKRDTPRLQDFRRLDVSHMLATEDDDYIFGLYDTTPDVIWPIDVALAMQTTDGTWNFTRAKTVSARDVRGKARIIAPKMLAVPIVSLYRDGRVIGLTEYLAYINNRWVNACTTSYSRQNDVAGQAPPDHAHFNGKGCTMLAAALRHRYEWSVSIGRPSGPSFRFATNATGIHALIKERDKPESGRRAALKAWVTDHWRQSSVDPEEEIYVRKHLRGGEAFSWRGYACEWQPSNYDMERNASFKAEREVMGRQAVRQKAPPRN